jgi:hypothetical protein
MVIRGPPTVGGGNPSPSCRREMHGQSDWGARASQRYEGPRGKDKALPSLCHAANTPCVKSIGDVQAQVVPAVFVQVLGMIGRHQCGPCSCSTELGMLTRS